MVIRIICVGKLKERYLLDAQREYLKRLTRFTKIEIVEVDEEKAPVSASVAQEEAIRQREAEKIRRVLPQKSFTIALALEGKDLDSVEFSGQINKLMVDGISEISFLIGSSTGLDASLIKEADYRFSMSKLTFPHQLARIILLEQVYRAFKIMGNEVYHK